MKYFVFLFFLMAPVCKVLCGNILILHFMPPKSFMQLLNSIVYSLAPNHNITIYSYYYKEFPHPNVSVVHVNVLPEKTFFSHGRVEEMCKLDSYKFHLKGSSYSSKEFIEYVLNDESIKNLFTTKDKYDMMMVSALFTEHFYQLASVLQVPLVQISATISFPRTNDAVGNSIFMTSAYNYVFFEKSFNFYNRLQVYVKNLLSYYNSYKYMKFIDSISSKYYPPGTPSQQEMNSNTSLLLSNLNGALGYVKPNMPHVVDIGGIFCRPPKPLNDALEDFIAGAEHGIIYVSFGASINLNCPAYITNTLVRVFRQLPQRILWKWNGEIDDLPANVKVAKWFSQQDILGHNKTKLFVTQGGILSLQEAVYHGVPVLAMPIVYDQPMNAVMLEQMGYGEYISFCDISDDSFAEEFFTKINEILTNPKYKTKVNSLSELLKEELETVHYRLNKAVNYVIRHRGFPIIHQLPHRSSGFERLDADIVVVLVLFCVFVLAFVVYIIFNLLKYDFKFIHLKPHID